MTFSVIVPTYNRKDKIMDCINSILNQSIPKRQYEIIVIDDGSTDGTYNLLSKNDEIVLYRLKKRLGRSKARNYGASKANGKYLVFTDSDCIVPENWLEKILAAYKKYPEAAGVGGGVTNSKTSIFGQYEDHVFSSYIREDKEYISNSRDELPFALGNMSYRTDMYLDFGGLNEKIPDFCSFEDAEIKSRFLKNKKKLVYIPVFVNHNHSFSLENFYRQSLERGAGMLLDSKKKGKIQRRLAILLKILATPAYFIYSMALMRLNLLLVVIDTLFYLFRNIGKLKYYKHISKLRL